MVLAMPTMVATASHRFSPRTSNGTTGVGVFIVSIQQPRPRHRCGLPLPFFGIISGFFFSSPNSFSCTLCRISGLGKKYCEEMNGQKLVLAK